MILRGTFDCLVQRRDGGITVLELKTGKPAPEHEQQLEMYLTAARAMFPGTPVEGKLVYARQRESGQSATRREALTSFSQLLRANTINGLADVRTIPRSRRHPHFGREALDARLKEEGIEYRHFADARRLAKAAAGFTERRVEEPGIPRLRRSHETPEFAAAVDELLDFGERRTRRGDVRRGGLVAVPPHAAVGRARRSRRRRAAHHEPARRIVASAAPADAVRADRIDGQVSYPGWSETKTGTSESKDGGSMSSRNS